MKLLYSICICNYNMASTIERSLESVLKHLDSKFEVLVVDDGSNDGSLEILDILVKRYPLLRVIPLLRDNRRKLGETRNISIRAAKGKFVLLHIDTDDVWEPYIKSFTKIFHGLEKRLAIDDFMLSGQQIQMAPKKLLIENPYPNVYYTEDRILWNNLAVLGKLIYVEHKVFRKRLPIRDPKKKIFKAFKSQYSAMCAAFSYSPSAKKTFMDYLKSIKNNYKESIYFSLLILLLLLPALVNGRIFSRNPLNNRFKGDTRRKNEINLKILERKFLETHGTFELDKKERDIFFS